MRLVHVSIPTGKREAVLGTLDDAGIDYVVSDETSGREYTALVTFPLPTEAVEPTLEDLRQAGLGDDAFTIVVDAETVVSRRFEELVEEWAAELTGDRVAREELRQRARDLSPTLSTYVIMTVLSVLIATAGLLLDSPAVIVGSMVIAPLIGPAMATSVGSVIDDADLFTRGLKLQVLGVALAVLTATVFAAAVRATNMVPPGLEILGVDEIAERLRPDFLSLVVALGAGAAGALSLRSTVSTALVGVMIAVALIPPTAVIGIGIAWVRPEVVLGSTVLVLVNVLAINLAALVVFWYSGYRPTHWFNVEAARGAVVKRLTALAVAMLLLSVFLGGVTYNAATTGAAEHEIREEVDRVLAQDRYAALSLVEVEFERGGGPLFHHPERVVVTVGAPPDSAHPQLARDIRVAVNGDSARDLTIEVRFVEVMTA